MPASTYSRYYGLDVLTLVVYGRTTLSFVERVLPAIVRYPDGIPYPDGILHQIVAGDTLDTLAKVYYGREDLWWRIADANVRKDPFDWKPGDTVLIPPLRIATRTSVR